MVDWNSKRRPLEINSKFPKTVGNLELISNGRRFDEYAKLFMHGAALKTFNDLSEHRVLRYLFPQMLPYLSDSKYQRFFKAALENADGIHAVFAFSGNWYGRFEYLDGNGYDDATPNDDFTSF